MTYSLHTAPDMARLLAVRLRDCRIIAHLTQEELAERADVSLSSLRRLERDGSGSLSALLKLAEVLDALDGFATLFPPPETNSLDRLETPLPRRVRKKQ